MSERRGRREKASSNLPLQLATLSLAAFTVLAPQILGGSTPETARIILVAGAVASAGATAAVLTGTVKVGHVPVAIWGMAFASMWTLVQLVPLPCSWFGASHVPRLELLGRLTALGVLPESRCTISASPGSTRIALAQSLALLALVSASTALTRAGMRRWLVHAVSLASVLMALVAAAHTAIDSPTVFGLYQPKNVQPGLLIAPLLNGNHLAGLLALGFPLCLTAALGQARIDARVCWLAASIAVLAAGLFTLSRGGAGALVLGGSASVLFHLSRQRTLSRRQLLGTALTLAALGVGAVSGMSLLAQEFKQAGVGLEKFTLIKRVLDLSGEHPWVGAGRGALRDVSPGMWPGTAWVAYAENLPVHWAVEWGFPVATLVLAGLGFSLVRAYPKRASENALWWGLVALILQNIVDYSLEVPGVACVAAVAFGVLIARERDPRALKFLERLPGARSPHLQPVLATASAAAALSVAWTVPLLGEQSRPSIRARLERELGASQAQFSTEARPGFAHYPLDPSFTLLAAAHAVRVDAPEAPRWLNLALEMAPTWSAPHLQAAYMLEKRGLLTQAAAELSFAGELDFDAWYLPVCDFLKRHPHAELALAAAGDGPRPAEQLERVVGCLVDAPAALDLAAAAVIERRPSLIYPRLVMAELAAQRGERAVALQHLDQAARLAPNDTSVVAARLRVLRRLGANREALDDYQGRSEARFDQKVLTAAAEAAADLPDPPILNKLLAELISRYGKTVSYRAQLETYASQLTARANQPLDALLHAQRAFEAEGTMLQAEAAHRAAVQANVRQVALRMASELCQLAHRDRWYCSNPLAVPP